MKKTQQSKEIDITSYINKSTTTSNSSRNQKTIELLEEFFSNMKTEDTTSNRELVEYLKVRGIVFLEKEIKTDLPLTQSTKTSSLGSGLIKKIKQDKIWIYKKI